MAQPTSIEWLLIELDKWIQESEEQAEAWRQNGMYVAESSARSTAQAYRNVKQLMENQNICLNDKMGISNQVPFNEICSCNPKNGGSGICGCTISNKMVDGK